MNCKYGKNLIGSFYQPHLVISDTQFLKTLPQREIICGYGEILKHSIINSKNTLNEKSDTKKMNNVKKIIKNYQKFIKENFKYVGENFAYEARSIHYENKEKKQGIYGRATKEDIQDLKKI